MRRTTFIGVGIGSVIALAIVAIGFVPVTQDRVLTEGVDAFQFHRPLFKQQTASQEIVIQHELEGLGVLLVNYKHDVPPTDAKLTITDVATGRILQEHVIPAALIQDDAFAVIPLEEPIAAILPSRLRLTLSAPNATSSNPLGIRFHPDNPYPASSRLENGLEQTGDLALLVQEKVPFGYQIAAAIAFNTKVRTLTFTLLVTALIAWLSMQPWKTWPRRRKYVVEIGLLLTIAVLGLGLRAVWLPEFHGVSGGDPYNYLFIAQQIAAGDNPFAISKRLPGFPLLLVPAYVTGIDDINWMRALSVLSGSISLLLLGLLARLLRFPWAVQFLAPLLLLFQRDFLWISFRPEPYTFFGMLLLLTLLLFFQATTRLKQIFFGIVLGYAAMTRQEGFMFALILSLATVVFWRQVWQMPASRWWQLWPKRSEWVPIVRNFLCMYLPALILVLPFFVHNTIAYGHPLYTEYFEGERLQIVDSYGAFEDAAGATWGILGSQWFGKWDNLLRVEISGPVFLITIGLLLFWWLMNRLGLYRRSYFVAIAATIGWLALLIYLGSLFIHHPTAFLLTCAIITAAAGATSIIPFLATAGWRGIVIAVVMLTQIMIALWFHPFAKHYQQAYPLLTLVLATALFAGPLRRFTIPTRPLTILLTVLTRVSILAPFALIVVILWQGLPTIIDEHNHDTALDSVLYRAIQLARKQPGPHGADQQYLQTHLYFTSETESFNGDDPHTETEAAQWITENRIRTLVDTNNNPAFATPPPHWQLIGNFKAEGNKEFMYESRVYAIP